MIRNENNAKINSSRWRVLIIMLSFFLNCSLFNTILFKYYEYEVLNFKVEDQSISVELIPDGYDLIKNDKKKSQKIGTLKEPYTLLMRFLFDRDVKGKVAVTQVRLKEMDSKRNIVIHEIQEKKIEQYGSEQLKSSQTPFIYKIEKLNYEDIELNVNAIIKIENIQVKKIQFKVLFKKKYREEERNELSVIFDSV